MGVFTHWYFLLLFSSLSSSFRVSVFCINCVIKARRMAVHVYVLQTDSFNTVPLQCFYFFIPNAFEIIPKGKYKYFQELWTQYFNLTCKHGLDAFVAIPLSESHNANNLSASELWHTGCYLRRMSTTVQVNKESPGLVNVHNDPKNNTVWASAAIFLKQMALIHCHPDSQRAVLKCTLKAAQETQWMCRSIGLFPMLSEQYITI